MKSTLHITPFILLSIIVTAALTCCARKHPDSPLQTSLEYSRFIVLEHHEGYSTALIRNPWDSTKILHQYTLIRRGAEKPAQITGELIEVPIDHIAIFSSVHAAILEALGAEDKIAGICEPQYLTSEKLRKRVDEGLIADLGPASSPNIEKMIDIGTRYLLTSPLENSGIGGIQKLDLPILSGVDYMENTPLGRTEWIKFFSILLDREAQADSIFSTVEKRYQQLRTAAQKTTRRPRLMTDLKYGGTWYLSGTDSYMVNLYKDAGADYIFQDIPGTGSRPMNFEYVLDKAIDADCWVIKYYNQQDMTYASLKKEYSPYAQFAPYRNRHIYGCNTAYSHYYDDIIMHPELILEDFIKIFHPELTTDTSLFSSPELHYFQPLD